MSQHFDLVVVAHPDDETIFCGGSILQELGNPFVVCVTNGNADSNGPKRRQDFEMAMQMLNVTNFEMWGFPDIFEQRLDVVSLQKKLHNFKNIRQVFTHGPLGEYQHPHHQDVCFAVHQTFAQHINVYSFAYNCYPDKTVQLSPQTYEQKFRVLQQCYSSELERFIHLLPVTAVEGFAKVQWTEVKAIYDYWTREYLPSDLDVKKYHSYLPFLLKTSPNIKRIF